MQSLTTREEIIELANKLFIYTDHFQWPQLLEEVFTEEVYFDMSSAGGGDPAKLKATQICDNWQKGLADLDAVHHQAGNYIVIQPDANTAHVFCYAIALHYKKSATQGQTREFVGSYDLSFVLTDVGWRISGFKYNMKYINGNVELK
jgi:hypothetical protein